MAHEWKDCTLGDVIELKRGYDLPQRNACPVMFRWFRRPGSQTRMRRQWSRDRGL